MKRIGLTGGVATGKSAVAAMFHELGWPVIDADVIVHALLAPATPTARAVLMAFGNGVKIPDGGIDRRALAAIVFADPTQRKRLEAILHPAVRHEMERQADRWAKQGAQVALFDIPLLFESNYDWRLDAIIVVTCDVATQLARCMAKFGCALEEARRRINTQLPLEEKIRRATVVIDNSGSLKATRAQIGAAVLRCLRS